MDNERLAGKSPDKTGRNEQVCCSSNSFDTETDRATMNSDQQRTKPLKASPATMDCPSIVHKSGICP
eukprot:144598-Amphidinium_carterae.1